MHPGASLLSLMLCAFGTFSGARSRHADALLTEMERRDGDRFMERQNIVPFRLIYSTDQGNETQHELLSTRIGSDSGGKQVSGTSRAAGGGR
uniref:Uncharacterized protein n=1 Tax=Sphaerodactylus townsendi TaxID=933632 RepID=A0ACB8FVC7_9SAUR